MFSWLIIDHPDARSRPLVLTCPGVDLGDQSPLRISGVHKSLQKNNPLISGRSQPVLLHKSGISIAVYVSPLRWGFLKPLPPARDVQAVQHSPTLPSQNSAFLNSTVLAFALAVVRSISLLANDLQFRLLFVERPGFFSFFFLILQSPVPVLFHVTLQRGSLSLSIPKAQPALRFAHSTIGVNWKDGSPPPSFSPPLKSDVTGFLNCVSQFPVSVGEHSGLILGGAEGARWWRGCTDRGGS
jgi:hypothetical protein